MLFTLKRKPEPLGDPAALAIIAEYIVRGEQAMLQPPKKDAANTSAFEKVHQVLSCKMEEMGREAYCLHAFGFSYPFVAKQLGISWRKVEEYVATGLTVSALNRHPTPPSRT